MYKLTAVENSTGTYLHVEKPAGGQLIERLSGVK